MGEVLSNATQEQLALDHLKTHKRGLTPLDAWRRYSIYRLAAVICRLRKRGYNITTTFVIKPNQFGEMCKVTVYKMEA